MKYKKFMLVCIKHNKPLNPAHLTYVSNLIAEIQKRFPKLVGTGISTNAMHLVVQFAGNIVYGFSVYLIVNSTEIYGFSGKNAEDELQTLSEVDLFSHKYAGGCSI